MNDNLDGRQIANLVLDFCDEIGLSVTNLALQKIVFFCHTWTLVQLKQPLIRHCFEAWEYGPVLPYLYHEFKHHKSSPITSRAMKIDLRSGVRKVVEAPINSELTAFVKSIVKLYAQMDASELVRISHIEDGPWHRTWHHDGTTNPGMKIDNESIRAFYSKVPAPYSVQ